LFYAAKIPIFSKWKRHFWQICERFASFSLHPKEILSIFAPAIPGEIGTARESAFFALFLDGESGQFSKEGG
jgi:hypothetical protein